MNILFTICGRAGSKGVRNKNIRNFCGFPLVYYSLAAIDLACKDKTWKWDVVVNSDSNELLELARNNPFFEMNCIVRDPKLGTDNVAKIAVITDCLNQMEKNKDKTYDVVVDLDITSPLRTVKDVENLITTHIESGADVTTSVTESRRNPYFNMLKKTKEGYKKVLESDFTTRQQAPEMFDMNASLYAYKPEFLYSGKDVLDGYCECIQMYDTGILDIDSENDFELMEVVAEYLFKMKHNFKGILDYVKAFTGDQILEPSDINHTVDSARR